MQPSGEAPLSWLRPAMPATSGLIAPANCNGVIAVTAHTINGENADYANIASTMTPKAEMLSAPGGGPPTLLGANGPTDNSNWDGYYIYSSVLFGPTSPTSSTASGSVGSAYAGFTGTSPATPHVAGVAALIKSFAPEATPAEIRSFLITSTSVRPYPAGKCLLQPAARLPVNAAPGCSTPKRRSARSVRWPFRPRVAGTDQVVAPGSDRDAQRRCKQGVLRQDDHVVRVDADWSARRPSRWPHPRQRRRHSPRPPPVR